MWTFINLGIIIAIITAVIGLKMHLRWWNWALAILSTMIIVLGSALLYTPAAHSRPKVAITGTWSDGRSQPRA